MNRPRWRWWLFCAALWLGWRTHWQWEWVSRIYSWSVRPEWLATPEEIEAGRGACLHFWPGENRTWGRCSGDLCPSPCPPACDGDPGEICSRTGCGRRADEHSRRLVDGSREFPEVSHG